MPKPPAQVFHAANARKGVAQSPIISWRFVASIILSRICLPAYSHHIPVNGGPAQCRTPRRFHYRDREIVVDVCVHACQRKLNFAPGVHHGERST